MEHARNNIRSGSQEIKLGKALNAAERTMRSLEDLQKSSRFSKDCLVEHEVTSLMQH